jgi:hypothetical protein
MVVNIQVLGEVSMNCQVARLHTRCHVHINVFSLSVLQVHFSRAELPISDYITHLKLVLAQSICIIQAMIDICANSGCLENACICCK